MRLEVASGEAPPRKEKVQVRKVRDFTGGAVQGERGRCDQMLCQSLKFFSKNSRVTGRGSEITGD